MQPCTLSKRLEASALFQSMVDRTKATEVLQTRRAELGKVKGQAGGGSGDATAAQDELDALDQEIAEDGMEAEAFYRDTFADAMRIRQAAIVEFHQSALQAAQSSLRAFESAK
jgi:hypothetical protein